MREHFDLDRAAVYLDAASITPRARRAAAAGEEAIRKSMQPWRHRAWDKSALARDLRVLAATMIGAAPAEMALTNAVSYGMASAAANLDLRAGSRILLLEDDHPSAALIWERLAAERGAPIDRVARPADGDWTAAVQMRLAADAPLGIAVLPPLVWTDGSKVDLARLAPLVRSRAAALVIDATQAAGVLEVDAHALDADFVAFPAYKWLMGPYSMAFLYVAARHHAGHGLEEHMGSRTAPALKEAGSKGDFSYRPGAERFDRGERDDGLSLSIALEGLRLSASVSRDDKRSLLWMLNDRLCTALQGLPVSIAPRELRVPHIIGLGLPGRQASAVADALAERGVYVSARRGYLRVAPYLYNDEADIDAFASALRAVLAAT